MMQLYNSLTVLPVQIPTNVLIVQAYYNNIINMEVLPKEWVEEIIKWLRFWEEPEKKELEAEGDIRMLQQIQDFEDNEEVFEIEEELTRFEVIMKRLDIDPKNVMHKLKGTILAEIAMILVFILLGLLTLTKCARC